MIEVGGGSIEIRDLSLLHSATERSKMSFAGKSLYSTTWLKAAALIQSITKNHPFVDGNKRTAFFSAMRFLSINNYQLAAKQKEIINFAISIDTKNLSLDKIASWFKKHFKKISHNEA